MFWLFGVNIISSMCWCLLRGELELNWTGQSKPSATLGTFSWRWEQLTVNGEQKHSVAACEAGIVAGMSTPHTEARLSRIWLAVVCLWDCRFRSCSGISHQWHHFYVTQLLLLLSSFTSSFLFLGLVHCQCGLANWACNSRSMFIIS